MAALSYRDAGVDIERGAHFAEAIYGMMRNTFGERVVEDRGGFGGLFSLDYDTTLFRRNYKHPILVASTDGVGTKLKVAFMTGRHDTVGIDLVAMCVNDILAKGAEPLFFLDYLATGELTTDVLGQVVKGISEGCRRSDCALLGGETAEMPGFYRPGEYDMAGFVVGVVDERKLITGQKIERGDVLIGLRSSGLHSNGYSLARKVFFEQEGMGVEDSLSRFGIERTLGSELLEPTRIYANSVRRVLGYYRVKRILCGIAHITGGGLVENVPRMLPEGCAAEIDGGAWERPRVFDVIQELGSVCDDEMWRVFNMGIGLVAVVPPFYVQSVLRQFERAGESPVVIGRVVRGDRAVHIT